MKTEDEGRWMLSGALALDCIHNLVNGNYQTAAIEGIGIIALQAGIVLSRKREKRREALKKLYIHIKEKGEEISRGLESATYKLDQVFKRIDEPVPAKTSYTHLKNLDELIDTRLDYKGSKKNNVVFGLDGFIKNHEYVKN